MNRQTRISQLCAARRVFVATLGLNLLVALSKLGWGFFTNTLSMIADGFHSLLDASSNVVGIVGLTISARPPDRGHPYGHRKFEALAAICISFLMFLASYEVLVEAVRRLILHSGETPVVSLPSYIIMLVTAAINLAVSSYERKRGMELNSPLLVADSQHTLSDVFATAAVLVSLVAIQFHYSVVDVISSLIVVGVILYAGFGIIVANLGSLVDAAIIDPAVIESIVLSVPGVSGCHRIRSRGLQDSIFIDLHVQVSPELSIQQAHQISTLVEQTVKQRAGGVVDVLVHMEEDTDPPENL